MGHTLTDHTIKRPSLFNTVFEELQRPVHSRFLLVLDLHQRIVVGRRLERPLQPAVLDHFLQGGLRKKLERAQRQSTLINVKHLHNGAHVGNAQHQDYRFPRSYREPHGDLHHHAEGSLSANHQLPQVVPSVVFDQPAVEVEQFTGAIHQFYSRHPIPSHTVSNHLNATGVGGYVTADLTGATGGEIDRVIQCLCGGEFLQLLGHHPRATANRAIHRIKVPDVVEAIQRQYQFTPAGNGSGAQASAAAGGHDCDTLCRRQSHNCLHFFHTPR